MGIHSTYRQIPGVNLLCRIQYISTLKMHSGIHPSKYFASQYLISLDFLEPGSDQPHQTFFTAGILSRNPFHQVYLLDNHGISLDSHAQVSTVPAVLLTRSKNHQSIETSLESGHKTSTACGPQIVSLNPHDLEKFTTYRHTHSDCARWHVHYI
jgi:hypothetical protein